MHDDFWLEEKQQGNFSAFGDIMRGDPGPHYTPAVDENGNLSWTNNGNLPNPQTQNIKGPAGKSAYQQAVEGGYIGTEAEFDDELANLKSYAQQAESARSDAITAANTAGGYSSQARQARDQAQSAMNAAQRAADSVTASAAQIETNKQDISDLKSAVDEVSQTTTSTTLGPAPIVTFDASAADMPLKGLVVNIEPVQSGTGDPSPDNVRPISGWTGVNVTRTGKNLLKGLTNRTLSTRGITAVFDSQGIVTLSGTNDGTQYSAFQVTSEFQTIKGAEYILSGGISASIMIRDVTAGSTDVGNGVRIVGDGEKHNIQIRVIAGTSISGNVVVRPMIRFAAERDSTFDSYIGTIYPITFPASAGTVYGGTLDVTSGVLTVTTVHKKIGDLVWEYQPNAVLQRFVCRAPSPAAKPASDGFIADPNLKAEQLKTGPVTWTSETDPHNYSIALDTGGLLFARDEALTTTGPFLEKYGDSYICYEIASPIVYDITGIPEITTLLGENNLWADTGDVTVTYGAYLETIKAHAERLGDSILSAIALLETSYTATRNYSIGSYLFVGTKFYKVIAAIQTGETITVDTNVEQTTVAEQLMNLAHYALYIVITEQPKDFTAAVGSTVSLKVVASGTGLSYQWQYGYNTWADSGAASAKTDTLSFTVANFNNGMKLRCVVTNSIGISVISDVATCTVSQ